MSKYGVIAKFDNPQSLVHAAEQVRNEGFTKFDCHSPFPIHGMDEACLLYTSPSPRDTVTSRMPSSA